jgi:leucyl aminopeptidase
MYKSQVKLSQKIAKNSLQQNTLILANKDQDLLKATKTFKLYDWQKKKIENLKKQKSGFKLLETDKGLLGLLFFGEDESKNIGDFSQNSYTFFRDNVSDWLSKLGSKKQFEVLNHGLDHDSLKGFGVGLELYAYSFTSSLKIEVQVSSELKKPISEGLRLGNSINLSRDLVDQPANQLNPKTFKEIIEKEFKNESGFTVKILTPAQLLKEGYGLINGVGQGAEEGPYLVHLSYKSKGAKTQIGAVGKGITFDTGGLDLKPSQFMRWMKKDMGGAGSLFGLAHWVKTEKPKVNCDFVFALAENSVSVKSFRPGDVLKAKNGTTVEIHNTDAEGRLALASGYNYLNTLKKNYDYMFNIATLTGAIKQGLGDRVAGLFTNSFEEGSKIMKYSQKVGDPMWMMPIPEWRAESLSSSVADLSNCSNGYGGSISAAEFLKQFAKPKENCVWFHMDIYAWTDSARGAFRTKGATGQAVQVLQEWMRNL